MINRRNFNQYLSFLAGAHFFPSCQIGNGTAKTPFNTVISTWNNVKANEIAYSNLIENESLLLNALEKGINYVEQNPDDTSVGLGGMPDSNGDVTLDACIMDKDGNAGSVTYMKEIVEAVSVARKIMEQTPHVILSGNGALEFAKSQGFVASDLLTDHAKERFLEWKKESKFKPVINVERHDTIGMLVQNSKGDMSGACSTSGLAFKTPGRVGDSPIIGAGLFVDNEVGAATATGLGELVLKSCSSFLVVELMRNGLSPEEACKQAVKRIADKYSVSEAQVGLIAINKNGEVGGYSIQPGFMYALSQSEGTLVIPCKSLFDS